MLPPETIAAPEDSRASGMPGMRKGSGTSAGRSSPGVTPGGKPSADTSMSR